jgi:flavin-dependent thymidylate synthase
MTIQFVRTEVIPYGMAPAGEKEALHVVEICGRTAYKSEDKMTEDSARSFVLALKKLGHLSVLEHSNIVLKVDRNPVSPPGAFKGKQFGQELISVIKDRLAYHRIASLPDADSDALAIAGNFRSWIETVAFLKENQLDYHHFFACHLNRFFPNLFESALFDPEASPCRITLMQEAEQMETLRRDPWSDLPVFVFKFICDRGITHEVVRHRVFSFTQESTRYVNYQNRGMTLILPEELHPFYDFEQMEFMRGDPLVDAWRSRALTLFQWYQEDLGRGLKPEIARDILPNLLKSEIFVSGRWSGWKHFIELRDSPKAHPRIRYVARETRKYFDSFGMSCS